MLLPYVMRKLNERFFKIKHGAYISLNKLLRKAHRYLGVVLIASAATHGILALGSLRIHTGTVLGAFAVITALFGFAFIFIKKKWIFKTHKTLAFLLVALLLVHLIVPSALYYIFGV